MYALMPVESVSWVSWSAHCCGVPWRNPLPPPKLPLTLNSRRISSGRRPASAAASSIAAFMAGSCSSST